MRSTYIPISVLNKLEQWMPQFSCNKPQCRGLHPISWHITTLPKNCGSLNIKLVWSFLVTLLGKKAAKLVSGTGQNYNPWVDTLLLSTSPKVISSLTEKVNHGPRWQFLIQWPLLKSTLCITLGMWRIRMDRWLREQHFAVSRNYRSNLPNNTMVDTHVMTMNCCQS